MKEKDLKEVIERCQIDKSKLTKILDISLRTLQNWIEKEDENISKTYILSIREIFQYYLIQIIEEIVREIFDAIPSESIALWIKRGDDELILLKNTALRYNKGFIFKNHTIIQDISQQNSLTLKVFEKYEESLIINGLNNIIKVKHKEGFSDHAYNTNLSTGCCNSLMKIPIVYNLDIHKSERRCLLALENKLSDQKKTNNREYTKEDEIKIRELATELISNKLKDFLIKIGFHDNLFSCNDFNKIKKSRKKNVNRIDVS